MRGFGGSQHMLPVLKTAYVPGIVNIVSFSQRETKMNIASESVELAKWTIGLTLLAALAACSEGGSNAPPATVPVTVATTNVVVPVTAATVAALAPAAGAAPTPFVFNSGFSGVDAAGAAVNLGGSTTFAVTSAGTPAAGATPATAPAFAITNGGNTASGDITFGSCIFTVKTSNAPSTSALAVGKVIKVDPCTLTVNTIGDTCGTLSTNDNLTLLFGSTSSISAVFPVTVSCTGLVTINNTSLGTVTLQVTTGAGS